MTAGLGWALALFAMIAVLVYDVALMRRGHESMSKWAGARVAVAWVIGLLMGAIGGHLFL